MAVPTYANSVAEVRGQAPPINQIDDGVSRYDYYQPLPFLDPVNAGGTDPFRADNLPSRIAKFAIAFTLRAFDKNSAENLTGDHGVIFRYDGSPGGGLEPFGGAYRAVVRPIPNAWDSGYFLNAAPTQ